MSYGYDYEEEEIPEIIEAAQIGDLNVVKHLIEVDGVDVETTNDYYYYTSVIVAALNGHLEVVKLLSTLPEVDAGAGGDLAIRQAELHGHLKVVHFLGLLPEVDVAGEENSLIRWTVLRGNLEMIRILASLPRVVKAGIPQEALDLIREG